MKYELFIQRGSGTWQKPMVVEPITWETARKDTPGKLTFTVVKDETLGFNEGASVIFRVDGVDLFWGFVFEKSRDKDHHIQVVAYDQLRYFKNKNAYALYGMTTSDFLKRICSDFSLKTGTIEDTGAKLDILYTNDTLFDMVQGCIDGTVTKTGKLYCLYDDYGKITLKDIDNLKLNYVITDENSENFDYISTIDSETYNRIKIQKADDEKKLYEYVVEEDKTNIKQWGILQHFEEWGNEQNEAQVREKAKNLLKLYNLKKRSLSVKGCFGDIRVRGGNSVLVQLALGDLPKLNNYMLVEEAKHTFENNHHTMELRLSGDREFYL